MKCMAITTTHKDNIITYLIPSGWKRNELVSHIRNDITLPAIQKENTGDIALIMDFTESESNLHKSEINELVNILNSAYGVNKVAFIVRDVHLLQNIQGMLNRLYYGWIRVNIMTFISIDLAEQWIHLYDKQSGASTQPET